jgi:hypothetical protein
MSPAAKKDDTKPDETVVADPTQPPDDTPVGTMGGKSAADIEAELLDEQGTLAQSARKNRDGSAQCEIHKHDDLEIECYRPEVVDNAGLCAAHWSGRPDLRRKAFRGK